MERLVHVSLNVLPPRTTNAQEKISKIGEHHSIIVPITGSRDSEKYLSRR